MKWLSAINVWWKTAGISLEQRFGVFTLFICPSRDREVEGYLRGSHPTPTPIPPLDCPRATEPNGQLKSMDTCQNTKLVCGGPE